MENEATCVPALEVGPIAGSTLTSDDTFLRGAFGLDDVTHEHLPFLPNDHRALGQYDESCLQLLAGRDDISRHLR